MSLISSGQEALLDDDQRMLLDAARKWIERAYGTEQRQAAKGQPQGFSESSWQEMAEMGWLGLGLPESAGGYGGAAEAALVAEQLGRGLVLEPWLGCVALAAPVLAASASPEALQCLANMTSGKGRVALAAWERQGRYDAFDVTTRAEPQADGSILLSGHKVLVAGGAQASQLIVLARLSGSPRDTSGLALYVVPANAAGLKMASLPTYDARQVTDLSLTDVRVPASARIDSEGQAWNMVEAAIDHATVMLCAECVGTMNRMIELTQAYTQERKQFGRTVASNQVVQHRLVDLWVIAQQMRAVTEAAVQALGSDAGTRKRKVSIAKAFLCSQGRFVGEDGVQLHGAIGMTEDYVAGQYYKRLAAAVNFLGDENWHLERIAALEVSSAG